jgi:hypothetical protein
MQNDRNQNEIAGRDAQNLPGRPAPQNADGAPPAQDGRASIGANTLVPVLSTQSGAPAAKQVPAAAPATPPLADAIAARFASSVASEAAIVRQLKPDMFNVALRPDAQTEILVNLVLRDGRVQAQATFSHGDAAAWSGKWTELQQALAPQGITLAPLLQGPPQGVTPAAPAPASFARSDDQPGHRQNRQDAENAPRGFENFPVPTKSAARPRAVATPGRRASFDNWA